MKRKWLFGLSLFLAGWIASRLPVPECPSVWAGGAACVDGDVNQDGALNITDPIHLLGFMFRGGPPPVTCSAVAAQPVSAVFIVRHCEKAGTPADDPPLTTEGMDRAIRLATVFKNAAVNHLIASEKIRTQQTLDPLREEKGIQPGDVAAIGDEAKVAETADGVVKLINTFNAGDVTVVAQHSTTIIPILKKLGVPDADANSVNTGVYDNLLLVLLPAGGTPQLIKLVYL